MAPVLSWVFGLNTGANKDELDADCPCLVLAAVFIAW